MTDDLRKDGYYSVVVVHDGTQQVIIAESVKGRLYTLVEIPSHVVKEVLIDSYTRLNEVHKSDNPKNSESTE